PAHVVNAPFTRVRPAVADSAAETAARELHRMLAVPVRIDYHGARRGALSQAQVARGLAVERKGAEFEVKLDAARLAPLVRPRLGKWIERASNARFIVAGGRVTIVPSRPGRDVDPEQVEQAITTALSGDHVARVELGPREPDLTTAK